MASYYPSFNYRGFNSLKDKNLMVVGFDVEDGETDTFLEMEAIYTDSVYGTKRIDYGARYSEVAMPRISVIKRDGTDFTVSEVRDFLKWTTGSRHISYLDMLVGNEVKFSFLGRIINVYQQKTAARTIGFTIEFESVSPYAYSAIQTVTCAFEQKASVATDGTLVSDDPSVVLAVDNNGVLYNSGAESLKVTDDGIAYFNYSYSTEYTDNSSSVGGSDSPIVVIDNQSDDLDSYVYLDVVFKNATSSYLSIKNTTLEEETVIANIVNKETINLNSGQFILSDKPNKIFGNDFNFVWPRLGPGVNQFSIGGSGEGTIQFKYRYPIKVGDCAIDLDVSGGELNVC